MTNPRASVKKLIKHMALTTEPAARKLNDAILTAKHSLSPLITSRDIKAAGGRTFSLSKPPLNLSERDGFKPRLLLRSHKLLSKGDK